MDSDYDSVCVGHMYMYVHLILHTFLYGVLPWQLCR